VRRYLAASKTIWFATRQAYSSPRSVFYGFRRRPRSACRCEDGAGTRGPSAGDAGEPNWEPTTAGAGPHAAPPGHRDRRSAPSQATWGGTGQLPQRDTGGVADGAAGLRPQRCQLGDQGSRCARMHPGIRGGPCRALFRPASATLVARGVALSRSQWAHRPHLGAQPVWLAAVIVLAVHDAAAAVALGAARAQPPGMKRLLNSTVTSSLSLSAPKNAV
jgi:hypothetical protein